MKKIISIFLTTVIIVVNSINILFISHYNVSALEGDELSANLPSCINVTYDQLKMSENFSGDSFSGYKSMYPEFTPIESCVEDGAWYIEGTAATNVGLLEESMGDFVALFECTMKSRNDFYYIFFHSSSGWPGVADSYIEVSHSSNNRYLQIKLCVEGTVYNNSSYRLSYGVSYSFALVSKGKSVSLYVWETGKTPSNTPIFDIKSESISDGDFYFYTYNGKWFINNIVIYDPVVTPYLSGRLLYSSTGYSLSESDISYRNDFSAFNDTAMGSFENFSGSIEILNHSLHSLGEVATRAGITGSNYTEFMATWDFSCYSNWATNIVFFGADNGWPSDANNCFLQFRHLENDGSKMAATLKYKNNSVSTEEAYFSLEKVYHIVLIAVKGKLAFYAWEKTTEAPSKPLLTMEIDELSEGDFAIYTYQSDTYIDNITVYDLSDHTKEPLDNIFKATNLMLCSDAMLEHYEHFDLNQSSISSVKKIDDFIVNFKISSKNSGTVYVGLENKNISELFKVNCNNNKYEIKTKSESLIINSETELNVICAYSESKADIYIWAQGETLPLSPCFTIITDLVYGNLNITGNIVLTDYWLYDSFFARENGYEKPKVTDVKAYNCYPSGIQISCEFSQEGYENYRYGTIATIFEGTNYNGCFTKSSFGNGGLADITDKKITNSQSSAWNGIAVGDFETVSLMAKGYVDIIDDNEVEHTLYSNAIHIKPSLLGYEFNDFGDCNFDSKTDIRDLIRLKKKIAQDKCVFGADYDANGETNSKDLVGMRMILLDVDDKMLTDGVDTAILESDKSKHNAKKLNNSVTNGILPEGVFYITEPIILEGGALRGAGKGKTIIVADFANKDVPIIYAGSTPVISDLTICYRDGLVTGKENQGERVGIYTTNVWPLQKGACIRNIEIKNVGTAIFSDMSKNNRDCMAFSVMFDKISIRDFSFRGFDFISPFRTGNIYSDIEISSGKFECDSAFFFESDNYDCEESETSLDSLRIYDTVSRLPVSLNGARALVAGKIELDNVVTTSGVFIDWDESSGVIDTLILKNSQISDGGALVSIGKTNFINMNSLSYIGINNLALEGIKGDGAGFKLFKRYKGLTDDYYVKVEEYKYSSESNGKVLDQFPVSDNLIFIKKGSELKESRLCRFYSKKKDENGNVLIWTGSSWK